MNEQIREIIVTHAGLQSGARQITDDSDLYQAGMKSYASVQLMLALEEAFDIEFPDAMLTRATFRNPAAIEKAVSTLLGAPVAS